MCKISSYLSPMKRAFSNNKELPLIILAFAAIYFIWGSTYLFNKIAIQEIPPFLMAGSRFMAAAVLIFLGCWITKTKVTITKIQIKNTFVVGFLFLTVGNGGVVWALQYVDSGFASLLISAQPLVLLLLLFVLEKRKIQLKSMAGILLGMTGIYLLVSQDVLISSMEQWLGVLIITWCLFSWGYGSLFVAKSSFPSNYVVNTGYQMLFGGSMLMLISLILGESIPPASSISTRVVLSLIYLILFGSIAAFTAFNFLLKKVSPEKVSTGTYVNPIVALILGWYILDEIITPKSVIAAAILLTGVYFINSAKSERLKEKAL